MQALGLAIRILVSTLSGLLLCLSRSLFGPGFGSGFELQFPRLLLCLSAGGRALSEQLRIVSVGRGIRLARYFSEDGFRRGHLICHFRSRFGAGIDLWLGTFCIFSLDVGSLLADLDVDCPLTCTTSTQRADRLALEGDLFRGTDTLTVTFFQVREQCLLVLFRHRLVGRGVRQARILHL